MTDENEPDHKFFAEEFCALCLKHGIEGASAEWSWECGSQNASVAYYGPVHPGTLKIIRQDSINIKTDRSK